MQDTLDTRDHDLLVRLDTKLDALSALFTEVRMSVSAKAESSRVDAIEKLVNAINNKIYSAMGGLAVLQVCIHLFWK